MEERAVLTIATGRKLYLEMASTLARSFKCWHGNDNLELFIATDTPARFPPDVTRDHNVNFIDFSSENFGQGFENKLHIDKLLPAQRTLFIDFDCLLTGSLDIVFDAFSGRSVSVVRGEKSDGEWFGDLRSRCERFEVSEIPVFVGVRSQSLWERFTIVEDNDTAQSVFEVARDLKDRYDDVGFVRLRGLPNEEPLISVGMALYDQKPIPDDGTIKADAMHYAREIRIDVLSGTNYFRGNSKQITSWNVSEAEPVIAHSNDSYAEKIPYIREQSKLRKIYADGASRF